jgi:hypothetical protein
LKKKKKKKKKKERKKKEKRKKEKEKEEGGFKTTLSSLNSCKSEEQRALTFRIS